MAKDLYHDLVKRALKKDGWEITHDPYELRVGGVEMYLAVPHFVYRTFFNLAFINRVIQRSQLNLLVYDLDKESIEQWIK